MKKIISMMLCALMLLSVMTLSAFAEDYTLAELKDYGQHVITLTENTLPILDGVIDDGEYAYSESVSKETTIYGTDNITATTYHFSYDEEFLYVAGVVNDASEHVNYVNALWLYISGDVTDLDNAWRIYMTKMNRDNVEHWKIVDSISSSNMWNPIDSKNPSGYTHGLADKYYEFCQNFVDGVYTYEIALDREDWGLTGDKMFIALGAASSDGTDVYGFKNEELFNISAGLNSNSNDFNYGVYMHLLEFAADGAVETEPAETEPAETEPAETEPAETEPAETEPAETTPVETEPAETEPVAEGGCGASVAAVAVALVAMLGTCVAFVNKRR